MTGGCCRVAGHALRPCTTACRGGSVAAGALRFSHGGGSPCCQGLVLQSQGQHELGQRAAAPDSAQGAQGAGETPGLSELETAMATAVVPMQQHAMTSATSFSGSCAAVCMPDMRKPVCQGQLVSQAPVSWLPCWSQEIESAARYQEQSCAWTRSIPDAPVRATAHLPLASKHAWHSTCSLRSGYYHIRVHIRARLGLPTVSRGDTECPMPQLLLA